MIRTMDLSGQWYMVLPTGETATVSLPGTLDENNIGHADVLEGDERTGADGELRSSGEILTRLTRNHTYEGPAYFSRMFETDAETLANRRLFLDVERSRMLTMKCNGVPVPAHVKGTVSTPYAFELTGLVKPGENDVTLCCDNSYPGWPHDAIVYSSAATDETQTNWNGLLGRL